MAKSRVWLPLLAGAAAVGTLAYAYRRVWRRSAARRIPANDDHALPAPPRESMVVPRGETEAELERLDLDGVFEGESDETLAEGPTVQSAARVPPLAGADDAEPPSPDELGSYWLSRAAQSEHSLTEGELILDFEDLAIAEPNEAEDADEGDRLSAEAWRG